MRAALWLAGICTVVTSTHSVALADPGDPDAPVRAGIGLEASGSAILGPRGESDLGGGGGGHAFVGVSLPAQTLLGVVLNFGAHWHAELDDGERALATSTPAVGAVLAWRPSLDLVLELTAGYAFGSFTVDGSDGARSREDTFGIALGAGPLWRFYLGGPTWLELGPWLGYRGLWVDTPEGTARLDQITLGILAQTTFDVRF